MMRLDKFLCKCGGITRSEAKDLLKKGQVTVNTVTVKDGALKVEESRDLITLRGALLSYEQFHYYMLHKPAGVVTATEDKKEKTVLDLLTGVDIRNLFPVGRLDKDTEGLLLITDNGELAHRLLAPKKHVDKTYYVKLAKPLTEEATEKLKNGVDIGDDTPTLPAKVIVLSETEMELTITEGRFHQIKRMLVAVENQVIYLKRLTMGSLSLPPDLPLGAFRPLTKEETDQLTQENDL